MKKSTIAMVAVVFAAFAAQATTTSANIVGYNKDVHTGGFNISAVQFDVDGGATPTTVFGDSLPSGSKIYSWNGSGYSISSYTMGFVPGVGPTLKWSTEPDISSGAFWVETPSAATAIIAGEVDTSASITNSIDTGFSLQSYPYPVETTVGNLGLNPANGDKIYLWNGTGYSIISYTMGFVPGVGPTLKWSDPDAVVSIGKGFWYENTAGTQEWVVTKPF